MFNFLKRTLFKSETLSRDQLKDWIAKNVPVDNQSFLTTVDELMQPPVFDQTELIKLGGELQHAERVVGERSQDPLMTEVNALKAQLQEVAAKLQSLRAPIIAEFNMLRTSLQNYSTRTIHQRELIEAYLNKPVETLARDRELVILHVLDSLPNDEQKQTITAEKISSFLKEYGSLVLAQNELIEKIDSSAAFHSLANAKTRVKLVQDKLKSAQEKLETLKSQELERRQIVEQTLLKQLKEKTGLTITLV